MSGWTQPTLACLFIAFLISSLVVERKNNWRKKEKWSRQVAIRRKAINKTMEGGWRDGLTKEPEWMNEIRFPWRCVRTIGKKTRRENGHLVAKRKRDLQDSKRLFFFLCFLNLVPPSQFSAFVQLVSFFFFFSPLNLSLTFHVRISFFFLFCFVCNEKIQAAEKKK